VAALWEAGLLWQAPAWLEAAQGPHPSAVQNAVAVPASTSDTSSSSGESTSSGSSASDSIDRDAAEDSLPSNAEADAQVTGTASADGSDGSSDAGADSCCGAGAGGRANGRAGSSVEGGGAASSGDDSDASGGERGEGSSSDEASSSDVSEQEVSPAAAAAPCAVFDQLDELFAGGGGRSARDVQLGALRVLRANSRADAAPAAAAAVRPRAPQGSPSCVPAGRANQCAAEGTAPAAADWRPIADVWSGSARPAERSANPLFVRRRPATGASRASVPLLAHFAYGRPAARRRPAVEASAAAAAGSPRATPERRVPRARAHAHAHTHARAHTHTHTYTPHVHDGCWGDEMVHCEPRGWSFAVRARWTGVAREGACVSRGAPARLSQEGILAFVCHLRATDQLLAAVDCPSLSALASLERHPAFRHLAAQEHRRAP
jgi:hypothetical protein